MALPSIDTPRLTDEQRERKQALEETISKNLEYFVEVGNALLEIKENALYREEYPTWDTYCLHKWGFTGRNGYFFIAGATTVHKLEQENVRVLPKHESTVRSLNGLDAPHVALIWNRSLEQAGEKPPTEKDVKEQRNRFLVENSKYQYVKDLVNNCSLSPADAASLLVVIDGAPDNRCRQALIEGKVRDKTVALELIRLYRAKSASFDEIASTRAIQSSTSVKALSSASASDLRAYLDEKQREHRLQALEEKNAQQNITSVSGFFWINDPERMFNALKEVLPIHDLRGLQALLNARL